MRRKARSVASALRDGSWPGPADAHGLSTTREALRTRWWATAQVLRAQGQGALAEAVEQFAKALPLAQSDQGLIAR